MEEYPYPTSNKIPLPTQVTYTFADGAQVGMNLGGDKFDQVTAYCKLPSGYMLYFSRNDRRHSRKAAGKLLMYTVRSRAMHNRESDTNS